MPLRGHGGVFVDFFHKSCYIYIMESTVNSAESETTAKRVEDSLRKKFHKSLFSRFAKAVVEYELIQPNDKIAVCISGGKDSFVMAKRHNKFPFELVFLVMDPGYSPEHLALIEANARELDIPVEVFATDIFESVFTIEKSPCYLCARMRRGHLYHRALFRPRSMGQRSASLGPQNLRKVLRVRRYI